MNISGIYLRYLVYRLSFHFDVNQTKIPETQGITKKSN
jgi:hypothetical protein